MINCSEKVTKKNKEQGKQTDCEIGGVDGEEMVKVVVIMNLFAILVRKYHFESFAVIESTINYCKEDRRLL
ncbi:Hypothetical predicted protein [Octopus vulgaris]|uniref:Uncharacterized protein n=1 Tax=Octopus vulgaris TaxID=6645 RepID=A0AA36AX51_OCTVU|nr:Hypothetical predicted protein [Octopus vulgaris]